MTEGALCWRRRALDPHRPASSTRFLFSSLSYDPAIAGERTAILFTFKKATLMATADMVILLMDGFTGDQIDRPFPSRYVSNFEGNNHHLFALDES